MIFTRLICFLTVCLQVNGVQDCDQTLALNSGVISSPAFPDEPQSTVSQCRYTIIAAEGQRIQLEMVEIIDMSYYFCYGSRLSVFEGNVEATSYCFGMTDRHRTFLSNGRQLLLVYNRNRLFPSSFRFRLKYTVCDGPNMAFNSSEGIISSPNLMNSLLSKDDNYTYTIQGSIGTRIHLVFSFMNLRETSFDPDLCLFIYEGYVSNSTLITTRCGTNTAQMLSATNILVLMYDAKGRDHTQITNYGFQVYYSIGVRGCDQLLTGPTGEIKSPLYPSFYPRNAKCSYNISAAGDNQIYLEILKTDLSPVDTLQIIEPKRQSGLMSVTILNYLNRVYLSAGNSVVIAFQSRNGVPSGGFKLKYTIIEGCSLGLQRNAFIASPLYPSAYPNDILCNYTFRFAPTHPHTRASLNILQLNVDAHQGCRADSLSVYDGSIKSRIRLDKMCGIRSSINFIASGTELFAQFSSNANTTGRGFLAFFSAVNITCNASYDATEGSIESVNFPNNYPNQLSCTMKIRAEFGNNILIDATHFQLESSTNCTKDSLEIYDGSILAENLTLKRCGKGPWSYISKSGTIFLKFQSDESLAGSGYRIYYQTCGGVFQASDEHRIKSPGFPRFYPNQCKCRYVVYGRYGFGIRLVFLAFSMQESSRCKADSIKVYEGVVSDKTLIATRCGKQRSDIFAKPGKLILVLQTDEHASAIGFSIYAQACSLLFTGDTGTLHSPLFPSRYPQGIFCTYSIRTRKGTKIKLLFKNFTIDTRFNLERKDYLQLYDGLDSNSPLSRNMSGTITSGFLSSGNSVFLELRTFNAIWETWSGFQIDYVAEEKGFCDNHNPCMNNASCISTNGGAYKCQCPAPFTGRHCAVKLRPCDSSPCPQDQICKNDYNGGKLQFSCECSNGLRHSSCKRITMSLSEKNRIASVASPISLLLAVAAILTFCVVKSRKQERQKVAPVELQEKNDASTMGKESDKTGSETCNQKSNTSRSRGHSV